MKKTVTLILVSIMAIGNTALAVSDTELSDMLDETMKLSETQENNPILNTKLAMLSLKTGTVPYYSNMWISNTGLSMNLSGGFGYSYSYSYGFFDGLDTLTGEKAIDESLQLGSIGRNRWDESTTPDDEIFDINDIEQVEIRSHPWEDMIEGKDFEIPEISKLVPKDTLFVYLQNPPKYLDLEKNLINLADSFGFDLYSLGSTGELRPKLFERLGIPDDDNLVHALVETAFVSEDIAFVPKTDYALILKFKNAALKEGFDFLKNESVISDEIGEYTVIATDQDLLEKINTTYQDENLALSNEKDFHYTLATLEKRRDGLIYFSEAFVRKLTAPAYRINSRRRNTVINALQNLQYTVFAYRTITDEWPESFTQIMEEGYIRENSIYEEEKYNIDKDGVVHHSDWGTLWNIAPISDVEITKINGIEMDLYTRFSEDYQSYFTEFFDPIGIGFTVSDQILFHTIILPIIDESEYNFWKSIFGGEEKRALDSIFEAKRLGAINFASKFSIDGFLLSEEFRNSDDEDLSNDEKIAMAEQEIAEDIGLKIEEGERLLDFLGDEIFFGVGQDNSFEFNNLADLDIWFGVKIKNEKKAKEFMNQVVAALGREFSGSDGFGFFSMSTTEPLKNEYNGVEYYLIPTGFVNLYYFFLDGNFYAAISQVAINRIIDSDNGQADKDFKDLERNFAFIEKEHHAIGVVDFEKVAHWDSEAIEDEFGLSEWTINSIFSQRKGYLEEALTLASVLPDYDGTAANVERYYQYLPEEFLDGKFEIKDGKIYFEGINIEDIKYESSYDYYYDEKDEPVSEKTPVSELIKNQSSIKRIKENLKTLKTGALGLSLTEEGFNLKLTFGNPLSDKQDDRFSYGSVGEVGIDNQIYIYIGITILAILLIGTAIYKRNHLISS